MLKVERIVTFSLIVGLAIAAAVNWRRASLVQQDNDALRAKVQELPAERSVQQASEKSNFLSIQ